MGRGEIRGGEKRKEDLDIHTYIKLPIHDVPVYTSTSQNVLHVEIFYSTVYLATSLTQTIQ